MLLSLKKPLALFFEHEQMPTIVLIVTFIVPLLPWMQSLLMSVFGTFTVVGMVSIIVYVCACT